MVTFLEVPTMIQQVLQYFRGRKLTIWNNALPPKKNKRKYNKQTRKNNTSPNCVAVFWALLGSVLFGPFVAWLIGPIA